MKPTPKKLQKKIVPVILSGGSGTRLWPLSRSMRPKQFINLVGEDSLFQKTLIRLEKFPNILPPVIVCNDEHRFMVAEQMQALNIKQSAIILEPVARNTAPAVATAAMYLANNEATKDCLMLVLPADHLIANRSAFINALTIAIESAGVGNLVTFGVTPDCPNTGYGYIKADLGGNHNSARAIESFVEKPDLATAKSYLAEGNYYWNSGMFLFSPQICLEEFAQHSDEILGRSNQALQAARSDLDFLRLDKESYKAAPNISFDYAIMERSDRVEVVPLDAGWSDIGSWTSLWESGDKDAAGNVTRGDVWLDGVRDSYVHSENKMVAALGVEDLIVVETHDGLLVTTKTHDQNIKQLVERLKTAKRPEVELHRKAFRPWGNYDCLDSGARFQVKRIMVKSGECTSMQRHRHRAEHWIVVSGVAEVTCGDNVFILHENKAAYIPLGEKHRLRNPGDQPLEIIEVQSGDYLGEDDIERFDDEYGRAGTH